MKQLHFGDVQVVGGSNGTSGDSETTSVLATAAELTVRQPKRPEIRSDAWCIPGPRHHLWVPSPSSFQFPAATIAFPSGSSVIFSTCLKSAALATELRNEPRWRQLASQAARFNLANKVAKIPAINMIASCLPRVAFVDHGFIMKLVVTKHLQSRSDSLNARADLPGIVASPIRASCPHLDCYRFPSGDASQKHGFDGVAEVSEANLFAVISSSSASTSTNSSSFNPGHPPCRNLSTAEAWHVFRAAMSRARFVYWCMLVRRAA